MWRAPPAHRTSTTPALRHFSVQTRCPFRAVMPLRDRHPLAHSCTPDSADKLARIECRILPPEAGATACDAPGQRCPARNAPTLVGSRYLFPYFTAACTKRIINERARTKRNKPAAGICRRRRVPCGDWGRRSRAFLSRRQRRLAKEGFRFQSKLD